MQRKLIHIFTTSLALLLLSVSFSPLVTTQAHTQGVKLAIDTTLPGDDRDTRNPADNRDTRDPGDNRDTTLPGDDRDSLFPNPVDADDIYDLINKFVDLVVQIGAIVAVLFIIWSGFLFIKAQGKPEELKKAKHTFWTTIIGVAILLGASVITKIIVNTVTSVTGDLTP